MGNLKSTELTSPCRRHGWRLIWMLLAISIITGASGRASAQEAVIFYNEGLFFEKVNQLRQIPIGATEAEVVRAVGRPVKIFTLRGGSIVFLYRMRLYTGPGPFEGSRRQMFLDSETRVVFDKHGRVSATHQEP